MIYFHKIIPLITSPLFFVLTLLTISFFLEKSKFIKLKRFLIFLSFLTLFIFSNPLISNKLVKYIHILIKKKFNGIINVGGPKISDYKKYKKFKKSLKPCDKSQIFNELSFKIATDASLNINKLKKIL